MGQPLSNIQDLIFNLLSLIFNLHLRSELREVYLRHVAAVHECLVECERGTEIMGSVHLAELVGQFQIVP